MCVCVLERYRDREIEAETQRQKDRDRESFVSCISIASHPRLTTEHREGSSEHPCSYLENTLTVSNSAMVSLC